MRCAYARLGLLPAAAVLLLQACATTSEQPPVPAMPDLSVLEKMQAGECSPATAAMIGAGVATIGVTGAGFVSSVTESGSVANTGNEVRSGADTNRWGCDPGAG